MSIERVLLLIGASLSFVHVADTAALASSIAAEDTDEDSGPEGLGSSRP